MSGENTEPAGKGWSGRWNWVSKLRVSTVMVVAGSLAVGIVLGWTFRSPESASAYTDLSEQHDALALELDDAQALETDYQDTVSDLREQVTQLESPFRELDDREGELDDREEGLDDREEDIGERTDDLEQREEDMDEREEGLDDREDEVTGLETEAEENSFPGTGTFTVDDEISPGTYRADGGSSCYWARLSSTDGSIDAVIANNFGGGQQVVTIAASDVAFETSSCGEWTRS